MTSLDTALSSWATLATGLGALLLYRVDGWGGGALVGGMVACLLAVVAILETAGRKKRAGE